jgi:hypothetical protein
MPILWAALLVAGVLAVLVWLPHSVLPEDRQRQLRAGLALLLAVLPFGFGLVVLNSARDRTRVLRFDYVGKRLAFGSGRPITAGSSPPESLEIEDLQAPLLGQRSVVLEPPSVVPAGAAAPQSTQGTVVPPPPAGILRLTSPSPAVRVDDRYCNDYALEDGDVIVVTARGSKPLHITYERGSLSWDTGTERLPSAVVQALSGGERVLQLGDLDNRLPGVYSFLHRPVRFGDWHLLIRSAEVRIERGGRATGVFAAQCPVPAEFDLSLEVVRDDGSLHSQRRDRVVIADEEAQVRFGEPHRWGRAVAPRSPELTLALGVPSAFAREEMIELPEPSLRFRGLSAVYRYDRRSDRARVTFLGDEQDVSFGDLYALGTGKDRMLVRLDRREFPRQILLDLALLSLFLAVFLGRGMAAHAGLAAVVAPVGLLLAQRLLFSHKSANHPPDFTIEAFEEARLALWLAPAFLVFAWGLAWVLRQPTLIEARRGAIRKRLVALGWPLGGLVLAAAGASMVTVASTPARRVLALLLPLGMAALLALSHLGSVRPRVAAVLGRLQRQGVPWRVGWLVLAGVAILAFRFLGRLLGMPETVRLPFSGFRLLWTVLQLPLCAVVVGLTLERLRRNDERSPAAAPATAGAGGRLRLPSWAASLLALYVFLALAFLAVAVAVGDTGLLLVHALAPVVALLVLAMARPRAGRRLRPPLAVAVFAALPFAAIVWINAFPGGLVRVMGWGPAGTEASVEPGAPVRERAAEISPTRAQQMFRLYMLANPAVLSEVGLEPAERVAIHYETLQSYARQGGWLGTGFLATELPRHLGITYLSDLVPMVFVLPEFGKVGLFGLGLLYLLVLAAVPLTARAHDEADRLAQQGLHVALVALLAFLLPGLYMLLANLNLVLFTGKNMSLLALNSLSDVLESATLLAVAVVGLGIRRSTT